MVRANSIVSLTTSGSQIIQNHGGRLSAAQKLIPGIKFATAFSMVLTYATTPPLARTQIEVNVNVKAKTDLFAEYKANIRN